MAIVELCLTFAWFPSPILWRPEAAGGCDEVDFAGWSTLGFVNLLVFIAGHALWPVVAVRSLTSNALMVRSSAQAIFGEQLCFETNRQFRYLHGTVGTWPIRTCKRSCARSWPHAGLCCRNFVPPSNL